MASLTADLKWIRQQAAAAQVEMAGRQAIGSMVVWDGQNESSVHSGDFPNSGSFSGLIVHLTPDLSPPLGTGSTGGISQTDFSALKAEIVEALVGSPG